MNPARVTDEDYIQFLLASQTHFTCTEAARVAPATRGHVAHDAFNRALRRQPPDTAALWREAAPFVDRTAGALVIDDSTLDKPYARDIELVTYHWSGKHHAVVQGINLVTLLWTDGEALIPCDFRLYDKPFGGETKNEAFRAMLTEAQRRGFAPTYILFDTWYSSLANLKAIAALGWRWLTRLKANRHVNPDGRGNVAVADVPSSPHGARVHLKGYGWIVVFRIVAATGDVQYWATNDLTMTTGVREQMASWGWGIEVYHRGLKQCCGVERCQARRAALQRAHVQLSLRAFLRFESFRLQEHRSWYQAKRDIVRGAVRHYLAKPWLQLTYSTA